MSIGRAHLQIWRGRNNRNTVSSPVHFNGGAAHHHCARGARHMGRQAGSQCSTGDVDRILILDLLRSCTVVAVAVRARRCRLTDVDRILAAFFVLLSMFPDA